MILRQRKNSTILPRQRVSTLGRLRTSLSSIPVDPYSRRFARLIQRRVRRVVTKPLFRQIGLIVTILNIIVLACDHHPLEPNFGYYAEIFNFIFLIYFAVEIVIKVVGVGFDAFWQ